MHCKPWRKVFTGIFFLLLLAGVTAAAPNVSSVTQEGCDCASLSFSHSTSGDNRLLVVEVAFSSGTGEVDSISYGGQNLTRVDRHRKPSDDPAVEVWRLVNPPTGSNTVDITLVSGTKIAAAALSLTEVDQDTPIDGNTTGSNTGGEVNVTVTSETDDLVMDVMSNLASGEPTVGAGQTQRWVGEHGGSGASGTYGAGSTEPGASSVRMNWSLAETGVKWAMIGFNINDFDVFPNISYVDPTPANNSFQNTADATINVSVEDDEAVDTCTFEFDAVNETVSTDGSTQDFCSTTKSNLADGKHNFTAYVNDSANQISNAGRRFFTVDTVFPNTTLNLPKNDSTILTDSPRFNFSYTDAISDTASCDLNLDGAVDQTNTSVLNNTITDFDTTNLAQGNHNWSVSCTDDAGNKNTSETRIFFINVTPQMNSISDDPDPIKGGDTINITTNGLDDPNNDELEFFCSETSLQPTSSNTICTGGNTLSSSPYSMSCTYATEEDDQDHTVHCRAYDGEHYSILHNTTYTTDSTPPDTSVNNVAGDGSSPYFDNVDDGETNITVDGESNMNCRWSSSDIKFSSMTNSCSTSGSQATCTVDDISSEGVYTRYVACEDDLGNQQNSTQNLNIEFTLDHTKPNTSVDSNTNIHLPGYPVNFTENDNIDGDPDTKYCKDTDNTCKPGTSIDDGGQVKFTNRGENFLRFNSTDDAGNTQGPISNTVNINTLPVLTDASDNATTIQGGTAVKITTHSNDTDTRLGQNYTLYVCDDTGANSDGCTTGNLRCSNTTTTANASCVFTAEKDDEQHQWFAYLFDTKGEAASNNPESGTYTTDSTPPNITIKDPENKTYTQDDIPAEISTSESTSTAFRSLDAGANVSMDKISSTSFSDTLNNLADGQHNITFWANDTHGNMGKSSVRFFSVNTSGGDTTPPSITVRSPLNNSFHSTDVLLNITTNEDLNNATFILDNGKNQTLDNTSKRTWNETLNSTDLGFEGKHNVSFWAEDLAGNWKHSVLRFFTFDTDAPDHSNVGVTPRNPDDDQDVTCHSSWTDNVELDRGIVQENATGTKQNHTIQLSGTSGDVNHTIPAADVQPKLTECVFFVNDTTGNMNTTTTTFTANDVTPPGFNNITNTPNTSKDLDPHVQVNVTANVTDDGTIDTVLLQFKNSSAAQFSNDTMTAGSGDTFTGNFTPDTEANWTYRIWANDTADNSNISTERTLAVENDSTTTITDTILGITSRLKTDDPIMDLGNITVNNTGDNTLDFNASADVSWITFNGTEHATATPTVKDGGSNTFNVTANTTNFGVGDFDFNITVTADETNGDRVKTKHITGTVRIQNEEGPALDVTITEFSSEVSKGEEDVTYTAEVENGGTKAAKDTWLAWTLPDPFILDTGQLNRSIGTLQIGVAARNEITIDVKSGVDDQNVDITATGNASNDNGGDKATKTVTIGDPVTQTVTTDSGGGGGGTTTTDGGGGGTFNETIESILEGERLLNSTTRIDIVRGGKSSFPITVSNLFDGTTMENLRIRVEGFLSQYIQVEPGRIPSLAFGEEKTVTVNITSPQYLEPGTHQLTAIITGKITGENVDLDLTDKRFITLHIHSISREEANRTVTEAEQTVNEMKEEGFNTDPVQELVIQARTALNRGEWDQAQDLGERVTTLRETAEQARNTITDVQNQLQMRQPWLAAKLGVKRGFPETEDLLRLAQAAMERGDYETAATRAEQAREALQAQQREFNFTFFLLKWWWAVILVLTGLIVTGLGGYTLYRKTTITQKIKSLNRAEETVHDQLRDLQKQYYEKGEMGSDTFREEKEDLENRLSTIQQKRSELRHTRTHLLSPENVVDDLQAERKTVLKELEELQEAFYQEKTVSESLYNMLHDTYQQRLTEIEKETLTVKLRNILDTAVVEDRELYEQ